MLRRQLSTPVTAPTWLEVSVHEAACVQGCHTLRHLHQRPHHAPHAVALAEVRGSGVKDAAMDGAVQRAAVHLCGAHSKCRSA